MERQVPKINRFKKRRKENNKRKSGNTIEGGMNVAKEAKRRSG